MRNDMVEWAEEENGKKGNGSEREIKKRNTEGRESGEGSWEEKREEGGRKSGRGGGGEREKDGRKRD